MSSKNTTECASYELHAAELSDYWLARLEDGEKLAPYSSRDGKYLRRIAVSEKLDQKDARALLTQEICDNTPVRRLAVEEKCVRRGNDCLGVHV